MRVLVDTNVIIDFMMTREPYTADAAQIIKMCADSQIEGYLAAHTIPNLFYILRKNYSVNQRKKLLITLCDIFEVSCIDKKKIIAALENNEFDDFEDCLQFECAKEVVVDYIITRNPKDFENSSVKIVSASDFLHNILL